MVELPAGSFVGKNWNTKELEGTILGSEGISNTKLSWIPSVEAEFDCQFLSCNPCPGALLKAIDQSAHSSGV